MAKHNDLGKAGENAAASFHIQSQEESQKVPQSFARVLRKGFALL